MKRCTYCGQSVQDTESSCPRCGSKELEVIRVAQTNINGGPNMNRPPMPNNGNPGMNRPPMPNGGPNGGPHGGPQRPQRPPMPNGGPQRPPIPNGSPQRPPIPNGGPQRPQRPPMPNGGPQRPPMSNGGPQRPPMPNGGPNGSPQRPPMSNGRPPVLNGRPPMSNQNPSQTMNQEDIDNDFGVSLEDNNVIQPDRKKKGLGFGTGKRTPKNKPESPIDASTAGYNQETPQFGMNDISMIDWLKLLLLCFIPIYNIIHIIKHAIGSPNISPVITNYFRASLIISIGFGIIFGAFYGVILAAML